MKALVCLSIFCLFINFVYSQEEKKEPKGIKCFACGIEEIDPEVDEPGSYGDFRKEGTPSGRKMYNHTCDIADDTGLEEDDRWLRTCPSGVKSCFWAKGNYENQGNQDFLRENLKL